MEAGLSEEDEKNQKVHFNLFEKGEKGRFRKQGARAEVS